MTASLSHEPNAVSRIDAEGPAAHAPVRIRDRIAAKRRQDAMQPGRVICPRCEGQKYDQGSCAICENRGWVVA